MNSPIAWFLFGFRMSTISLRYGPSVANWWYLLTKNSANLPPQVRKAGASRTTHHRLRVPLPPHQLRASYSRRPFSLYCTTTKVLTYSKSHVCQANRHRPNHRNPILRWIIPTIPRILRWRQHCAHRQRTDNYRTLAQC